MKNTFLVLAGIAALVFFFWALVTDVNKSEQVECSEWREQAAQFPAWYSTQWQREAARFEKTAGIVGAFAALAELTAPDIKASNESKKRILAATYGEQGLNFPEDWDALDEETKAVRLDAAIAGLKK